MIATKAGLTRHGPGVWTPLGRPAYLRQEVELSLRRLGLERIDLLPAAPHRPERTRVADQVGELKELQDEGKIRHIGLSEVSVERARRRPRRRPRSCRSRTSTTSPSATPRRCSTMPTRESIGFIPWFPLATGELVQEPAARWTRPPSEHDATPSQLALAWLLKRSPVMLPIPGTSSVDHLEANIAAAAIELTDEEFEALSGLREPPTVAGSPGGAGSRPRRNVRHGGDVGAGRFDEAGLLPGPATTPSRLATAVSCSSWATRQQAGVRRAGGHRVPAGRW